MLLSGKPSPRGKADPDFTDKRVRGVSYLQLSHNVSEHVLGPPSGNPRS